MEQINKLTRNLEDAGCDADFIEEFFICHQENNAKKKLQLLSKQRKQLLENVHKEEQCICCLDYLVHEIEKEMKGKS